MTADPFESFKVAQRENWKSFAPLAMTTTPSAAKLVAFAGVRPGQNLLDAGCGTGVVAITARRAGARVTGLDLTASYLPSPPDPKPAPPHQWGDPNIVLKRLGNAVRDVAFDRSMQITQALSPQHYRRMIEQSGGPVVRLLQSLKEDPARLAQ